MLGIMFRYAIPRAPWFFRLALCPAFTISGVSLIAVGLLALIGDDAMFLGSNILELSAIYLASQFIAIWGLVGYAFYHQFIGRHKCPV